MKYLIAISFIMLMASSCLDFVIPEDLTLPKRPYTGDELRIDGYYYYDYLPVDSEEYVHTYFLYENGIILDGGITDEDEFTTQEWIDHVKKYRHRWGLFNIDGDNIVFERWMPRSPAQPVVFIHQGKILNDTTFHISSMSRLDGSDKREVDRTYHFKQFSPKPNSTNKYIK